MIPNIFTVTKKIWENSKVYTISLVSETGLTFDHILPGQFNMLYAFGVGEAPISISRPYNKNKSYELVHTIRSVGDVTRALSKIEVGGLIGVRGPFGNPWPLSKAIKKNVLLIAGGIALAPLRPAIDLILSDLENYESVTILIGARNPNEIIFLSEILDWKKRVDVHITVDSATEQNWNHHVGLVTSLISYYNKDPKNTIAMICGPEVMMKFVALELKKRNISEDDIYLSMERNMKCATGHCGHCQYGPSFVCKDGPVYSYAAIQNLLNIREI